MSSLHELPVVVIGCNETALRAIEILRDAGRYIVGCAVETAYRSCSELAGIPVLDLDHIREAYPPDAHAAFVAVGSGEGNHSRERLCNRARLLGYGLTSAVSPSAHIGHRVILGPNVFVMDGAIVGSGTDVGEGTTIWGGVNLSHLERVGRYVWLAPSASFGGGCTVGSYAFVGVNATVLPSIAIGEQAVVGAGCVLTHDADACGVYVGVPGVKIGDVRQMEV